MTTIAVQPEEQALLSEAEQALEWARMIEVETGDDFAFAAERIATLKAEIKRRETFFAPMKRAAHEAHKAVTTRESESIKPLKDAIAIIEPKAIAWKREQDRQAEMLRRELEDEARRQEEERRLAEAVELEAEGLGHMGEALLAAPIPTPKVNIPMVKAGSGLTTTKRWKFEIVDPTAVNRAYLMPDEVKIGKIVTALKADAAALVGGIRVYEEETFRRT